MSTPPSDPLIRATADVLRRSSTTAAPKVTADDRMRAILAMEAARDQRRTRPRTYAVIAAAAALLLVGSGVALRAKRRVAAPPMAALPTSPVARSLGGGAVIIRGDVPIQLESGSFVKVGDRVVSAKDGRAGISLPSGTHLLVGSGGDLALTSAGPTQTFSLAAGGVRADVAKLHAGERFIVRTSDAEIEVRGTSFSVERVEGDPACAAGNTTRVHVLEGAVVVRAGGHETVVVASDSWPHCQVMAPQVPAAPLPSISAPSTAPTPHAPSTSIQQPKVAAVSTPSELAEQNDMFSAAVAAKRSGDARGAVASFERLLAKYPNCALAEQASVERLKLLATFDHGRAAAAAKAYLARYPKGYARTEAQAIVTTAP